MGSVIELIYFVLLYFINSRLNYLSLYGVHSCCVTWLGRADLGSHKEVMCLTAFHFQIKKFSNADLAPIINVI